MESTQPEKPNTLSIIAPYGNKEKSEDYEKYRPQYPEAFIQMLLDAHCPERTLAIDVATGTGFVARTLSTKFKEVHGIDSTEAQIEIANSLNTF